MSEFRSEKTSEDQPGSSKKKKTIILTEWTEPTSSASAFSKAQEIADYMAAVQGTRSHLVGRVDGVDIEYHGPSPEVRQLLERYQRNQARREDLFFSPAESPIPQEKESAQDDQFLAYSGPD